MASASAVDRRGEIAKTTHPPLSWPHDDARLTGLDEFLETAAYQKAFPLDYGHYGIEVAEEEGLECPSRPGLEGQAR